ncbi:MAG: hypothetical protein JSV91_09895 [Phycisphaerales bacterium]|nr:MAG: hypothetical protein JSV91_09895 [Phycisphaerales bacterium]
MITRFTNCRVGSVLAALVLAGAVGGCASAPAFLGGTSRKITLNNVSSTALNITFYVWTDPEMMQDADAGEQLDESGAFMSDKTIQLGRGETAKYSVARSAMNRADGGPVVHVKVQPVSPSWERAATEYWLEVLTDPPVSIVATGTADALAFNTGDGEVALIPSKELESGRFDHRVVTVTESEE